MSDFILTRLLSNQIFVSSIVCAFISRSDIFRHQESLTIQGLPIFSIIWRISHDGTFVSKKTTMNNHNANHDYRTTMTLV